MVIKKLLLIILIITSTKSHSFDKFIVKDINFEGLQRVTIKTALLNIPIKIGDSISNEDISMSIHNLFLTGNFKDIKVLRNKNSLTFKIKEQPTISNIFFKGNKYINNDTIKYNLNELDIKTGEVFNYTKILNFKKKLENFYFSVGKFNTKINLIITKIPKNRVNIELIFSEGPSVKIKQINIIGNKKYKTEELVKKLQLRDYVNWWDIFNNKKYQKQKLENDLEKLQKFYLDQGYARFKINSTQINLSKDKKNIFIIINIEEGKQYKISNIEIINNSKEYLNNVEKLLNITPGSTYNGSKITQIKNKIKNILETYGYSYPKIIIKSKFNDKNKTIKLLLNIDHGKRFYVRRIYFQGDYNSKDSVLRREIRQMEGTWLENNLVKLGKERLNRTGFFENVDVEIKQIHNSLDQVDVIYKIKERDIGSINFGLGFGAENGINFHVGAIQNNLLGTGNEITVNANKNDYSTNIELAFTNPYLTISGINIGSKFFYNNFNAKNTNFSSFQNKICGFDNFLVFPINEHNSFRIGPSYVHNNLSNLRPQASIWHYLNSMDIYPTLENNNKTLFYTNEITLNAGWTFNSLNHIFFPTSGKQNNIFGKITIPGSDNKYYKLQFNSSQYYPFNKKETWVLLLKSQAGYGNGFNNKQMPFFENFYAGGSNSIRGFLLNNIGPKAIYLKNNPITGKIEPELNNSLNDSIGGNIMYTMTFELIIPTPFINENNSDSIRTSIFIDAGTVWDTNWKNINSDWKKGITENNNSKSIHSSIGIALQWISPLGPLTFSYAQPIKSCKNDKIEQFQFNIGKTW